jgi:hypothetical protein
MPQQVFGLGGRTTLFQVPGRSNHDVAQRWTKRHRDHVERNILDTANAGIEPTVDDVDDRGVAEELQLDVRVGTQEPLDQRSQDELNRRGGCVDADRTRRLPSKIVDILEGDGNFGQGRLEAAEKLCSGLGDGHAACRSVQQPHAQALLQIAHHLTDRLAGHAAFKRCFPEAARTRNDGKGLQVIQARALHW